MNWETIKKIYKAVLKHGYKIKYINEDKYILYRLFPNGQKECSGEYKNGKGNGKHTWWKEYGPKRCEGFFRDNLQHGETIHYFSNGRIKSISQWEYGIELDIKRWNYKGHELKD